MHCCVEVTESSTNKQHILSTLVYLHEMWPKAREWEARDHFKVCVPIAVHRKKHSGTVRSAGEY
jgi:hypothetical protein